MSNNPDYSSDPASRWLAGYFPGGTVKASGTLQYVGNVGTLPNIIVGSGTLQTLNSGSLQYVGNIGTIPNIIVGSGTIQMLNGGTLNTLNSGTLNTLNSGTLQYIGNIGTIPNVIVGSGTLQTLNNGTLTSVGSANVYSKHDNHTYHTWGTYMTAVGTLIPGIADKLITIHQYSISAEGTILYNLMTPHPLAGGGTIDYGGLIIGNNTGQNPSFVNKPFVPYPGYLCKTVAVGSALCLGTYAQGMSGTVYFQAIYTDDDTA